MNSRKYSVSGSDQLHFCGLAGIGFVVAAEPDIKSTITADSIAISIP